MRQKFKTQKLKNLADYLFSAKVLNVLLPLLMVYVVWGTVAQKSMGLYKASEIFFYGPIIWVGGVIPLPGMPMVLAALLFCLVGHVLFKSPYRKSKLGILLAHLGVIFLVGAGLFSGLVVQEGALMLAPGETKATYSDYHKRVVTVTNSNGEKLVELPFENLLNTDTQGSVELPFPYALLEVCENCNITAREQDGQSLYYGMAEHMQLSPAALNPQNEQNLSGMTIAVPNEIGEESIYLALDEVPVLPQIPYGDEVYELKLDKEQRPLPFEVQLIDFKRDTHPGTMMASAYQSHVRIIDGATQWEGVIKMNDPLRYKGYALFQSSFAEVPDGTRSVLAVVYNPYRVWPYYATGLIALGIILHLIFGRSKNSLRRKAALAVMALMLTAPNAMAADAFSPEGFGALPILHEGRVKPIESFAAIEVKGITGQGSQHSLKQALAQIIFAPAKAANEPLIKVQNRGVVAALELPNADDKRYSFATLQKAFTEKRNLVEPLIAADPKTLMTSQQSLLEVYQKTQTMAQLLASLTVLMPLDIQLEGDDAYYTYAQWLSRRADIGQQMKALVAEKGSDIQNYTADEQALSFLSFTLARLAAEGRHATLFKVVPAAGEYHSPWTIVNESYGTPETAKHFALWQSLTQAYNTQDAALWQSAMAKLNDLTPPPAMLEVERFYNKLMPVETSLVLYGLGLLLLMFGAIFTKPALTQWALLPVALGGMIHLTGVCLRVAILQRPPVGTLYESVLFVGLVLVGFTLWRLMGSKDTIWLWLGAAGAVLMQALALTLPQSGDDMTMLTAVLNTNFWLLIHVLTITAGYGFCLVVSGLAHVCYADDAAAKKYRPALRNAVRLALLFTFIGTLLGGVWADQSWGRFWGWDPKENGALLIVLWILWLLHGEVSKSLPWRFILAGYVLLSGVVALSWLGVNLLSVGLHNYGFTDAMAVVLVGVWGVELAFIAFVMFRRGRPNV